MRKFWIGLGVIALVGAVALLVARRQRPVWTTESPAALAAFEEGLDARMKLYHEDALAALQRAVELDPHFAAAKIALMSATRNKEVRSRLLSDLQQTDLARLSPRERFMVRYTLAKEERDGEEERRVLTDYLEAHPKDPFALEMLCEESWRQEDLDGAEEAYRRLLEANPNWVTAHNRLGYIAMAQGRFAEAESQFKTYAFIAPDQANPHDSMGELLTLLGRYEEATGELERALEIRPDFCFSYMHLAEIPVLQGRPQEAEPVIDRMRRHCDEALVAEIDCQIRMWKHFLAGNLEEAWDTAEGGCLAKEAGGIGLLAHRVAVLTDRMDEALAIEKRLAGYLQRYTSQEVMSARFLKAFLLHLEGVRKAAEGDQDEAARLFQAADRYFLYWGNGQGIFKLFNQLNLAHVQREAGDEAAAQATLEQVRTVNPAFADHFTQMKICMLGG